MVGALQRDVPRQQLIGGWQLGFAQHEEEADGLNFGTSFKDHLIIDN